MQLACNTILFGGLSVDEALKQIAQAGFSAVEMSATKSMGAHISDDMSPSDVAQLKSALAQYGLSAVAVEIGGATHKRLSGLLSVASELGVSVVNISSGGISQDPDSFVETTSRVREIARIANGYGVQLAVKPHVGHAVFDTSTSLQLVQAVNEPNLGLNFDPSHLYRAGEDPAEVIDLWGDAIISSHFRDCELREQRVGPPETQVPGAGAVDLISTLAKLTNLKSLVVMSLQIVGAKEYPAERTLQLASDGYDYLQNHLPASANA